MLTQISQRAYAQELIGPISGAMGGAGVAANDVSEQIFLNPAAIAHSPGLSAGYYYQGGYVEPRSRDEWWGASITDNEEDLYFAGGALYTQRRRSFAGTGFDETHMEFAGASLVVKYLAVGASVYRVSRKIDGDEERVMWDASLAMLFNPDPAYAFGLVYRNLARHSEALPPQLRLNDRLELGSHFIFMPQFRGRFDLARQMERNPDGKLEYHLGFESLIDGYLVFRFGYEDDQLAERSYYCLGAGFEGPRLKVDYAFRQNTEESSATLHSVDFRVPF